MIKDTACCSQAPTGHVADRLSWAISRRRENTGYRGEVRQSGSQNHVNNFLNVKTRNRNIACTIENGSLCAKYAHLGILAHAWVEPH